MPSMCYFSHFCGILRFLTVIPIAVVLAIFGCESGEKPPPRISGDVSATKSENQISEKKTHSKTVTTNKVDLALDDQTKVQFADTPIVDAIKHLAKRHDIKIVIDEQALHEIRHFDESSNLTVSGVKLRSVLRLILEPLALTYVVRDDALLITTEDAAYSDKNTLSPVTYPVEDFAAKWGAIGELMDLIRNNTSVHWRTFFPDSPDIEDLGTIEYSASSKSLVVTQIDRVHEEIAIILQQLRKPLKPGESIDLIESNPIEKKIQQELDSKTEIDFRETPLRDVLKSLSNRHKIPIVLNESVLAMDEVAIDLPISSHLSDVSLRSGLKVMLDPYGLTYVVRNEVVLITTIWEEAYSLREARAYAVGDILKRETALSAYVQWDGKEFIDNMWVPLQSDWTPADEVISLILMVDAHWAHLHEGEGGNITFFAPNKCIVVHHSPMVHRQIARVLTNSRKPIKPGKPVDLFAPNEVQAIRVARIKEVLNTTTEIEFDKMPLKKAMDFLSRQYKINIVVDTGILEQANISIDILLNCQLSDITLGSGLKILLKPFELSYRIEDECIKIVPTPLATRLYSLDGLEPENAKVFRFFGRTLEKDTFEEYLFADNFADLIENDLAGPVGWRSASRDFPKFWRFSPLNCLVVRYTNDAHEEFSVLMDCLRHRRRRADSPARKSVLQSLEKPVELPARQRGLSLAAFIAQLSAQVGIEVEVPLELWVKEYKPPEISDPTLRKLIEHFDLPISFRGKTLVVGNLPELEWDVYPVPGRGYSEKDLYSSIDRFISEVAPESWGKFGVTSPRFFNGCLVLRQTAKTHKAIPTWLKQNSRNQ